MTADGCLDCVPKPHQGGYGHCECDCHLASATEDCGCGKGDECQWDDYGR